MSYDFKSLDPIDFEQLSCDILSREEKQRFEIFKTGRDQGIDLLYVDSQNRRTIVQCKHYAVSGFASLKSKLVTEEIVKVKKLNPYKYILITSVPLSLAQKQELLSILYPFCKKTDDIWGADELNTSLRNHQDIQKAHYKLWLTSSAVLEQFLNNKIFSHTYYTKENISRRFSLYVEVPQLINKSVNILENEHSLIISGPAGAGKTTLAEILLTKYLEQGFEAVSITGDIDLAFSVDHKDKKIIFLYDDFMGQVDLLNKDEDSRLTLFMQNLKTTRDRRLILTTREYILQESKRHYERLNSSTFEVSKFILDLKFYGSIDKARIVFKHLYFLNVDEDFVDSFISDINGIKRIIDHQSFSPRVIETVCLNYKNSDIKPEEFIDYFISTLDAPDIIWDHSFKNKLNESDKCLLILLATFKDGVMVKDLEEAHKAFYKKYSHAFNGGKRDPHAFQSSLKRLMDSFIRSEIHEKENFIFFLNPSVRDFLHKALGEMDEVCELLFDSFIYADQAVSLLQIEGKIRRISGLIEAQMEKFISRTFVLIHENKTAKIYRHSINDVMVRLNLFQLFAEVMKKMKIKNGLELIMEKYSQISGKFRIYDYHRFSIQYKLADYGEIISLDLAEPFEDATKEALRNLILKDYLDLIDSCDSIDEISLVADYQRKFSSLKDIKDLTITDEICQTINSEIEDKLFDDDYDEMTEIQETASHLIDWFNIDGKRLDTYLELVKRIEEIEMYEDNRDEDLSHELKSKDLDVFDWSSEGKALFSKLKDK